MAAALGFLETDLDMMIDRNITDFDEPVSRDTGRPSSDRRPADASSLPALAHVHGDVIDNQADVKPSQMDVDTAMKNSVISRPSDRRTDPPSLSPSPFAFITRSCHLGGALSVGVRPRDGMRVAVAASLSLLGACVGRVPLRVCARGSESKGARGVTLGALCA
ncbi:hypothetical protein TcBrA4_0032170 [Trypanosoma cruzi]|nr:hypothetical protein TcBrA4_0032170 [Trypanosoma cruzi]